MIAKNQMEAISSYAENALIAVKALYPELHWGSPRIKFTDVHGTFAYQALLNADGVPYSKQRLLDSWSASRLGLEKALDALATELQTSLVP